MIQEDYVSFEVANLLKDKGFDEPCRAIYEEKVLRINTLCDYCNSELSSYVCAPTHQMAMAWLRKNHNICITIYPDKENGYEAVLYDIKNDVEIVLQSFGVYGIHIYKENYEEAVESALKYVLENLI